MSYIINIHLSEFLADHVDNSAWGSINPGGQDCVYPYLDRQKPHEKINEIVTTYTLPIHDTDYYYADEINMH